MARLAEAAEQASGVTPDTVASWSDARSAGTAALPGLQAPLDRGFIDTRDRVAVLAAPDVLGSRATSGENRGPPVAPWQVEAAELHLNDVVVHAERGVGRLAGLERLDGDAVGGEAIRVAYAKGQVLAVPIGDAGKLWRYGAAESDVPLDRLDGGTWEKRRAKVVEALRETAAQLVAEAGPRRRRRAPKLVAPQASYERFIARFPFVETRDQRRAIAAVLDDLASGRPMNRLIVGDVGFGKTEVALRAAAAAAFAGKQVAVVAPTTVLARQHFETFRRRFSGFGIEVGHLSRLVGTRAGRDVRRGLSDGSIRVVAGTHALLGDGIVFADLGLVVVDEEQRFGVRHKRCSAP